MISHWVLIAHAIRSLCARFARRNVLALQSISLGCIWPANWSLMSDKLSFTATLPEYSFKPGDHVVNALIADGLREGKYTVEELHSLKMIVLEVGRESIMGFKGYQLVYHSQPEPSEYVP